jgi:hypothetical protein
MGIPIASQTKDKWEYTTRSEVFPDGQKPSGKTEKPSGVQFLTGSRQEQADRNRSDRKEYFLLTICRQEIIPDGSS